MTYLRTAIFVTVAFIVGLLAYLFLSFGSDYELGLAEEAFASRDYEKVEHWLKKVEPAMPKAEYHLYRAYLLRQQQYLAPSTSELITARESLGREDDKNIALEIEFNLVLNGYLLLDGDLAKKAYDKASYMAPNHSYTPFLHGIALYTLGNYHDALNLWLSQRERTPLSKWMQVAFADVFDEFTQKLLIARCHIQVGNFLPARQILEAESQKYALEDRSELVFLLGLSYALEANTKPLLSRGPYYRLAMSYFNRVPVQDARFARDMKIVKEQVAAIAHQLIDDQEVRELLFYTNILDKWEASEEVEAVARRLVGIMNGQIERRNWRGFSSLVQLLTAMLGPGEAKDALADRFEMDVRENLKGDKLTPLQAERLPYLAQAAVAFSAEPEELRSNLVTEMMAMLSRSIANDSDSLAMTRRSLSLLEGILTGPADRLQLAQTIVGQAEMVYREEEAKEKAVELIQLAATVPAIGDRDELRSKLRTTLKTLYDEERAKKQVGNLSVLVRLARGFGFTGLLPMNPIEVQEQLELADDELIAGKLSDAEGRARWILEFNESDSRAHRILGLVQYYSGNYTEAFNHLSKAPSNDRPLQEALVVSQFLGDSSQLALQLMSQLESQAPLMPTNYLRLGLGVLGQGLPDDALYWLAKLPQEDPEVQAGQCFAYFLKRNWAVALRFFNQLPTVYSNLRGFQGIATECMVRTGKTEEAEELLGKVLGQSSEETLDPTFSQPFALFINGPLRNVDPSFIAGRYFERVKKQPEIALNYYEQMNNPTPVMYSARAMLAMRQYRYSRAAEDFEAVMAMDDQERLQKRIAPRLMNVYTAMGDYDKAFKLYERYRGLEALNPDERKEPHALLAGSLAKMRRFDLSRERLDRLMNFKRLGQSERVDYIEALLHTQGFFEAIGLVREWASEEPAMALKYRLKLARLMVVAGAEELIRQLLASFPAFDTFNDAEMVELIRLYIELGAYGKANSIVERFVDTSTASPDLIFRLAELKARQSNFKLARQLAEKALRFNPDSFELIRFENSLVKDLDEKRQRFNAQSQEEEKGLGLEMLAIQQALDLAEHETGDNSPLPEAVNRSLRISKDRLINLASRNDELPDVYYYLARIHQVLGDEATAIRNLEKATQLDSSHSDAYRRLAEIYTRRADYRTASFYLGEATRYAPSNAVHWRAHGVVAKKKGDLFEAKESLESAVKFGPNDPLTLLAYAEVLVEMKNTEDAKQVLYHLMKVDNNPKMALQLLLICLYDHTLKVPGDQMHSVVEERQRVFDMLHSQDSEVAERLIQRLEKQLEEKSPGR